MINIIENKCDYCGTCVGVCPVNCIDVDEEDIRQACMKMEYEEW